MDIVSRASNEPSRDCKISLNFREPSFEPLIVRYIVTTVDRERSRSQLARDTGDTGHWT